MAIDFGYDASGRGNNWTANNLSSTAGAGNDSLTDTPTSYGTDTGVGGTVRGNYATLNPLINPSADTFSNGNLQVVTSSSNYGTSVSTMATPTTGKWYAECTIVATASYAAVGICSTSSVFTATSWIGSLTGVTYYGNSGQKFVNASGSAYGATYGANDIIGVAYDADNLQITFYKNGTTQGLITGVTAGTYYFGSSEWDPASGTQVWNFGQRAFAYTAPSGFKALCTQNLPTPTIGATSTTQANQYFDVKLATGSNIGSATLGAFSSVLAWIKDRVNINNHQLLDSVRGTSGSDVLQSNTTSGTVSYSTPTGNSVGWVWKANGAGSSNTAGTITSTVSANTTSGFSIVTYTGTGANATVGHGLGVAPSMVICKNRSVSGSWLTYHASVGNTAALFLNQTGASITSSTYFNNTSPTSTVFSLGDATSGNGSGNSMVAYCFAPVAGYSAFGSYTGNGSTDGPFVYLGFRPEFIMTKSTSNLREWYMYDAARDTYNVSANYLRANTSSAEGSFTSYDMVSNGFKLRSSDTAFNGSGETYIYMAFAEFPFKFSLAR